MPPKIKVQKEDILSAALELVREESYEALSARSLAKKLGCSTQPIFSNFENMQALQYAVIDQAYRIYTERIFRSMERGRYPAYKESGMAYIEFAVEEPQLFKMLFMRDRSGETIVDDTDESEKIIAMMMEKTGLSYDNAHRLHRDLWIVVHGLATMFATGFERYDEKKAGEVLSEAYFGILRYFNDETEKNK